MRLLPQLTPFNEWLWTSGADGRLRIQGCQDCKALVHPPVPVCPSCRSRSSAPTEVSGRATVVGFTVNSHPWLPGFDPPYVIAVVALAEDPSIRLTTNVVGCEPDEVRIGQEVTVRFEQHDDVWLPLFEPTGEIDPVDRVGEPVRPAPRPPVSSDRFEHKAVLSGVGRSAIGRRLMVDPLSLTVDANAVRQWEPVRKAAEEAVKSIPGISSALIVLTAERTGAPAQPRPAPAARPGGAAPLVGWTGRSGRSPR